MKNLLLASTFAAMVSGCTSIQIAPAHHNVGQTAEFEKETVVTVGDVMFGQFDYRSINGAILIDNLNVGYQAMTVKASSGDTFIQSTVDGQISYCSVKLMFHNIFGSPVFGGCLFDRNDDKAFETIIPAMADNWGEKPITPVKYDLTQISASGKGFKYELLYNGVSGNTLNITYREFIDQMARPAFQQDLTYTISKHTPTDIAFRGARITVLNANNTSVKFIVHSGIRR